MVYMTIMKDLVEVALYPKVSAVYFLLHANTVVYVGQSKDLRDQFHISRHAKKTFDRFMYVAMPLEKLDEYERACIVFFKPKYNHTRATNLVPFEEAESIVRGMLSENELALLGIERRTPYRYEYEYPRPAVTVDCVVFGFDLKDTNDPLKVLLIQRKSPPHENCWALPGGFVNVNDVNGGESLERAAQRELEEETGVLIALPDDPPPSPVKDGLVEFCGGWMRDEEPHYVNAHLEQLYTFGRPDRDPRGRVISVAYFVLVPAGAYVPHGSSDAAKALWVGINSAMKLPLAFDHAEILNMALTRLQGKIRYAPIGLNLLPNEFTLGELKALYEGILRRSLDLSNFRKRALATGVLAETGAYAQHGSSRPAKLYRFDKKAYDKAVRDGFNFEI